MADSYAKTSGNGYNKRTLKRMKLSYKGTTVKFAVNPEDYTQTIPNRVTVTQTKGGAWLDAWGAGIVEFTIKGTTGVKGTSTNIDTGYQRWRTLRTLFAEVFQAITDGEEVKDLIALYNYTDNEYWYCFPSQSGIELYRSKSRPHMYQYTLHLLGIREIGQPETAEGVIGNPNDPAGTGKSATATTKGVAKTVKGEADDTNIVIGTTTKSKSVAVIQEQATNYCKVLEPIIGGKGGKISPATGFMCAQSLNIISSGTVYNVSGFNTSDLFKTRDSSLDLLTAECKFQSLVSLETYKMYEKIKDYSPDVLSASYAFISGSTKRQRVIQAVLKSTAYDSTLIDIIEDYYPKSYINKNEINMLKMIMLDCMNIYMELYKIKDQSEISTSLTKTSAEILARNLSSLTLYFELKDSRFKYERMDICNVLRQLEKVVIQTITNVINYL